MDIYFILWFIFQYFIIYFIVQIITALAIGNSFNWLLCPLATFSLCLFHVHLLKREGILCILLILEFLLRRQFYIFCVFLCQ